MITRQYIIRGLMSVALIALGWLAHLLYDDLLRDKNKLNVKIIKSTSYTLTSPLLDIELPQGIQVNQEPIPFKHIVEDYIANKVDGKAVTKVALYYRNLQDGPWFGISEDYRFHPASMIKIPVMIAWLKKAERNPSILNNKLVYTGEVDATQAQNFKPAESIKARQSYTVDDLIRYMLSYSDNNAYELLLKNLKPGELLDVLAGMGVPNTMQQGEYTLSVHEFSGYFRGLYNATYLNREMSEKALKYLCFSDFPQGIVSGVPKGTTVASKFGEQVRRSPQGEERYLHEFGIVYHPICGPYIIGIMTKGTDFSKQMVILGEISKLVYDASTKTTRNNK